MNGTARFWFQMAIGGAIFVIVLGFVGLAIENPDIPWWAVTGILIAGAALECALLGLSNLIDPPKRSR